MKVIALLSWYEESPTWLASLTASLKGFADHIVAVDGAYFLYPDALQHPVSGPEQAEAIVQTAKACGMGCTIHVPEGPWAGNETEKRTFLFELGNRIAEPFEDWFFVVDGDDIVDSVPFDARQRLEETDFHSARVQLFWREDMEETNRRMMIAQQMKGAYSDSWTAWHWAIFRAIPSLRIGFAHQVCEYDHDDGTVHYLRGRYDGWMIQIEDSLDLTDLRVEHRHPYRNPARTRASEEYYALRNELEVEAPPEWMRVSS